MEDVFNEVAELVLGGGISKMNPTQSDLATHQKKDRRQRAITATLSAIGGTAGSAGAAYAGRDLVHRVRPPKPRLHKFVPRHKAGPGWKAPAAVLGLEAVGLGGEVMSTKILGNDVRQTRKKKGTLVAKRARIIDSKVTGPFERTETDLSGKVTHTIDQGHGRLAYIPTKRGVLKAVATNPKVQAKSKKFLKEGTQQITNQVKKDLDELDASFEISKADADKQQVFGWASVVEINGEPVVDLQGDYISPEEMEKAGYTYVMKSRKGGDMHLRNNWEPIQKSEMIESFIVTPEKRQAMGIPDSVPTGWWVGFQVQDPTLWADVKSGKRTGFSIHGRGKREPL